jgi:hypothetical protein
MHEGQTKNQTLLQGLFDTAYCVRPITICKDLSTKEYVLPMFYV